MPNSTWHPPSASAKRRTWTGRASCWRILCAWAQPLGRNRLGASSTGCSRKSEASSRKMLLCPPQKSLIPLPPPLLPPVHCSHQWNVVATACPAATVVQTSRPPRQSPPHLPPHLPLSSSPRSTQRRICRRLGTKQGASPPQYPWHSRLTTKMTASRQMRRLKPKGNRRSRARSNADAEERRSSG